MKKSPKPPMPTTTKGGKKCAFIGIGTALAVCALTGCASLHAGLFSGPPVDSAKSIYGAISFGSPDAVIVAAPPAPQVLFRAPIQREK